MNTVAIAEPSPAIKTWLQELSDAYEREKDWRKQGKDLVELYECEQSDKFQFNILYSNTETLAPALYNTLPRPVVQRRFKDEDPKGKLVSKVIQRSLEYLLDNDIETYTSFDDLIQQSVLEALVPGRGIIRFKYDASFVEVEESPEDPAEAPEGETTETPESPAHETSEQVSYETVCGESVPWNRFRHGYAKQWKDVPWVAFEHLMTKEELKKNFGEAGVAIPLTVKGTSASNTSEEREHSQVENADNVTLAQIFEVWDKASKKVLFIAPAKPDKYVKEVEDPLELSGFFPMPEPLTFFMKISSLVPVPLYQAYEEQAKELNRVTVRINKIIGALKVRGFYDASLEGIEKVLQADDNTLIAAENVAAMQQGQTLEKAIWLMPLEKLVAVLQQLYLQRQQIKTVIYEITGISDILRGASVASETATAQNIKNQWGTLRLKRMQKLVMIYVRRSLRIMAEIACSKLSEETLASMTGLQYPTAVQKQQAVETLQRAMQQIAAAQAQGQQVPPEMQQSIQKLQQIASMPSWTEVKGLLGNDIQRNYTVDIETNSTVDAEATEDKQNMGEFLNAVAQFLNGVGPLVQEGIMPFDAAKAILLAVTRRYRFGVDVEDEIQKMQAPQQQGKDGGKAQAEQQQHQMEVQQKQMEMQGQQQEQAHRAQLMQSEQQLSQAETAAKLQEIQRTTQLAEAKAASQLRVIAVQEKVAMAKAEAAMAAAMAPKPAGNTTE